MVRDDRIRSRARCRSGRRCSRSPSAPSARRRFADPVSDRGRCPRGPVLRRRPGSATSSSSPARSRRSCGCRSASAIAFLYLGGLRFWPGVLIGDLLANDYSALPLGSALGQTAGQRARGRSSATLLLRRLLRDGSPLGSVRGLARMLVAIAAGDGGQRDRRHRCRCSLGGVIDAGELPSVWRTWWLGDFAGRARRRPARARLVRAGAPRTGWAARLSRRRCCSRRRRPERARARSDQPAHLPRLPGADLGRAALRPARRDAGRRGRRRLHRLEHHPLRRPVRRSSRSRAACSAPSSTSPSRRSRPCASPPSSPSARRSPRRSRASRARLVEAADTERRRLEHNLHDGAQQRLIAARRAPAARRRARARRTRSSAAALSRPPRRELQLAIDELRELAHGIHPACSRDLGLARRDPERRRALDRADRRSSSCRRAGSTPPPRRPRTTSFAEAVTNAQKHAARRVDPRARRTRRRRRSRRGRRRRRRRRGRGRRARASRACATASRRSAARSRSRARRAAARGSWPDPQRRDRRGRALIIPIG